MRSLFEKSGRTPVHGQRYPSQAAPAPSAPVRITAVAERTSGHDEHLGFLLRDMRLALPMTPGELALRLGTSVDVIAMLEQGRLRALPPWEETHRVVAGLCAMHHVDPRPILHRILEQTSRTNLGAPPDRGPGALHRTGGRPAAATVPAEPAPRKRQAAPPPPKPAKRSRRWRRPALTQGRGRVLMAVAGPMVMIAAAVWAVQAQPRALHAAIEVLPQPIERPLRQALDAMAMRLAKRHDGMRWIEVADPSTRKADKLDVGTR